MRRKARRKLDVTGARNERGCLTLRTSSYTEMVAYNEQRNAGRISRYRIRRDRRNAVGYSTTNKQREQWTTDERPGGRCIFRPYSAKWIHGSRPCGNTPIRGAGKRRFFRLPSVPVVFSTNVFVTWFANASVTFVPTSV